MARISRVPPTAARPRVSLCKPATPGFSPVVQIARGRPGNHDDAREARRGRTRKRLGDGATRGSVRQVGGVRALAASRAAAVAHGHRDDPTVEALGGGHLLVQVPEPRLRNSTTQTRSQGAPDNPV